MTYLTLFLKSLPVIAATVLFLSLNSIEQLKNDSSGYFFHFAAVNGAGRPAAPSLIQSADTIGIGVPFRVAASYAQGEVQAVTLRLYQNDTLVQTVPVSTSVEFSYPVGLPVGTYTLRVVAVTADGIESCSDGTCANPYVTLTVAQTCTYSLSASNSEVPAPSTTVQVNLTAQIGCGWSATASASWMSVSPASGSGNATLLIVVQANTGTSSRAGVVTVQGQTYTITQAGALAPALSVGYTLRGCTGIVTAAAAPDTRTGWGIQFRKHNADGTFTNFGTRDITPPYQRNPGTLAPGAHTFSGVWTRTSTPSVVAQSVTFVCN